MAPFPPNISDAYLNSKPDPEIRISPGWYRARAVSTRRTDARTGSTGLRVEFVMLDGTDGGLILHRDFWLSGQAVPITKRDLDTVGFAGLTLDEIEAFQAFDTLPAIRMLIGYREFRGRQRVELQAFAPDTPGGAASSTASPDATPPASSSADHRSSGSAHR